MNLIEWLQGGQCLWLLAFLVLASLGLQLTRGRSRFERELRSSAGFVPTTQAEAAMHALQLRAWSHAVTIRIARITGNRETDWNTASGVLLEIGDRAVIATAWHVLEGFRDLRTAGEKVALVCDNMPILEPRTAYRDEASDLVLLDVPAQGRAGLKAVPYRPGHQWPPPAVTVGDDVLLCGFPKLFRHDGDEILHGDLNLLLQVASAAHRYFMLQVDWDTLVQTGRVRIPRGQADFGGASGGPAFLSDQGCNALVGVIIQAGDTLPLWRVAALSAVPAVEDWGPSQPV